MDVTRIFTTQQSLPTSVVFLTIHDTLLIARGQRSFLVSVFFFFAFFVFRWSRMLLTQCVFLRSAPNVT